MSVQRYLRPLPCEPQGRTQPALTGHFHESSIISYAVFDISDLPLIMNL